MPKGSTGGSFFSYGDTIARQVDGVWEYSTDGGETWTNEAPEGFESDEDGTRFRFGGGDEDSIPDIDAWLDQWFGGQDEAGEDDMGSLETMESVSV